MAVERLTKVELKEIIDTASKVHDVDDKNLIFSIIMTESGANPLAIRYEYAWKYVYNEDLFSKRASITSATESVLQSCSLGLMQVMGTVARELGHLDNLLLLTEPSVGVYYGVKKLKQLLDKHKSLDDVISAYNMGTPRKDRDGSYINQKYVNKVKEFYNRGHF